MKKKKNVEKLKELASELYDYRNLDLQDETDRDDIKGILSEMVDAGAKKDIKLLYEAMWKHGATITIDKIDKIAEEYGAENYEKTEETEDEE
jgi:hypothetical protein